MSADLSQWDICELLALVDQGMPLADYAAELKRREVENGAQHH